MMKTKAKAPTYDITTKTENGTFQWMTKNNVTSPMFIEAKAFRTQEQADTAREALATSNPQGSYFTERLR